MASACLRAVADFGFQPHRLCSADIEIGRKVIEMGVPPVQIHVMSQIDGLSWEDVWRTRGHGTVGIRRGGVHIGREVFLRNKRAAGRPKDLADIDALRQRR